MRGRDGARVEGSVILRLPDIFPSAQQHLLARVVFGLVDLLQVERELQLGERTANRVLVEELGLGLLRDRVRQPQQSLDRAEQRRAENASDDAHWRHLAQSTTMLTKL